MTTLSLAHQLFHAHVHLISKLVMVTRYGMNYLFYFILYSVVLYGFAMIEQTPTDPKEMKWWNQVWTKSFQQMMMIMQPIIQSVTNYVE